MAEYFAQDVFLKYLAALLAIFNPLYAIPIFLSMTGGMNAAERRRVALIVAATATVFAIVCVLLGEELLAVFGIDVPSFRIAGGLILLGIGFRMLNAESRPEGDRAAIEAGNAMRGTGIAIVPLTIPLTIGPGALAVTIVFAHQLNDTAEVATLIPAVLIACLICGLGLVFADAIARSLGATAISVATRIMAIVLVAVSVEMILTGAFDALDARYPQLVPAARGG